MSEINHITFKYLKDLSDKELLDLHDKFCKPPDSNFSGVQDISFFVQSKNRKIVLAEINRRSSYKSLIIAEIAIFISLVGLIFHFL